MINKAQLTPLREDINNALAEIGKKHGFDLHAGNCSYDENTATFKLKATSTDESGDKVDVKAENFKKHAFVYGLEADDLGKSFTSNGTRYKITGAKPRNRKYPIIGVNANGTSYKFAESTVKSALGK